MFPAFPSQTAPLADLNFGDSKDLGEQRKGKSRHSLFPGAVGSGLLGTDPCALPSWLLNTCPKWLLQASELCFQKASLLEQVRLEVCVCVLGQVSFEALKAALQLVISCSGPPSRPRCFPSLDGEPKLFSYLFTVSALGT